MQAAGDEAEVRFDTPARAVTKGQICVLYDGDRVVGGGEIAAAL
ncbi:MAG: aminomethyltransferase beta-barrel domain-containing protein [Polyangiales bacterium]